jgi:HEPN domain-containing protein
MTRKRYPPDDAREWLNRARSNLAHARLTTTEILFEDLCYDAQQAAEKAIKAVFIHRGEHFPYVHELNQLLGQLAANGLKIPKYVYAAGDLSPFAVWTRYPGLARPVTQRTYRRAVRLAGAVLHSAERIIGRP